MRLPLLAVYLLAGGVGCTPAPETQSQTIARLAREASAARRVIDSLNVAYLQPSPDLVAQYTDDAEVVAGPLELKGRAAIGTWIMGGASMGGTMRLRALSVSANGPLAIERGVYTMSLTPPGAPSAVSENGNYLIH